MQKELTAKILDNSEQDSFVLTTDSDPRTRFLSLSNPENGKLMYYINFRGGHLILGMDVRKILTSLELNIEKAHWTVTDTSIPKISIASAKLLQFPNIEIRANENEMPVKVFTDKTSSFALITIDDSQGSASSWIPLSKQCFVGIKDNYLQGFSITLG